MTVNELISIFRGSQQYVPLQGLTELALVQYTLDKIYAVDADVRIVQPAPYIATTSGTTSYGWDSLVSGVSNMRRIRGIFNPSLTSTNVNDYDFVKVSPVFDQNQISTRYYYRGVFINQEQRTLTFLEDPGTTTIQWKVDYYPYAPTVAEETRVPVLAGWELDLVYTGMMAWFEESKAMDSGYWVPLFEGRKKAYYEALKVETQLAGVDHNDYQLLPPFVKPV